MKFSFALIIRLHAAVFAVGIGATFAQAKVEIAKKNDFSAVGLNVEKVEAQFEKSQSEGLRYLFSKMNQIKAKRDPSVNLRFGLSFVEDLGGPFTLEPLLDDEGQLVLDLKIKKEFKENPVVLFEALVAIQNAAPRDGSILSFANVKPQTEIVVEKVIDPATGAAIEKTFKNEKFTNGTANALAYFGLPRPIESKQIGHPLDWLELHLNARNGSSLAQRDLLEAELFDLKRSLPLFLKSRLAQQDAQLERLRDQILEVAQARGFKVPHGLDLEQTWTTYSELRIAALQQQLDHAKELAQKEIREMKKARENPGREAKKNAFESAAEKFEALVKKNDRAGVAEQLETYLPWEQFSPVETSLWRQWLESIRHPDTSKSKILYRGIDQKDRVQVGRDAKGKETGFGFFPTLLTRNQGNYSRRLRSYESMRLKLGTTSGMPSSSTPMPKISSIMFNHAEDPNGSPFMSLTSSPSLAVGYATAGNIAVVRIDERRLMPNVMSPFKAEAEFLVPMVIFPDEVLYYPNRPMKEAGPFSLQQFILEAKAKAGIEIAAQTQMTDTETFAGAFRTYAKIQQNLARSQSCKAAF